MRDILASVLLAIVLGAVSFTAGAQLQGNGCGPGGHITEDGYCNYPASTCIPHLPGHITSYCIATWQQLGLWPKEQRQSAPPPAEPCKGFGCPGSPPRPGSVNVQAHFFGVIGRDDATGKDVIKGGYRGDVEVEKAITKECPNCRFIFYWVDSCFGEAKAKQANGRQKSYYASAGNATQTKQKALNACKA